MDAPKQYADIGHGDQRAFIWIVIDGKLATRNAKRATHEITWGPEYKEHWSGRYECATKRISMRLPGDGRMSDQGFAFYGGQIVKLLRARFGQECEIWAFRNQEPVLWDDPVPQYEKPSGYVTGFLSEDHR